MHLSSSSSSSLIFIIFLVIINHHHHYPETQNHYIIIVVIGIITVIIVITVFVCSDSSSSSSSLLVLVIIYLSLRIFRKTKISSSNFGSQASFVSRTLAALIVSLYNSLLYRDWWIYKFLNTMIPENQIKNYLVVNLIVVR